MNPSIRREARSDAGLVADGGDCSVPVVVGGVSDVARRRPLARARLIGAERVVVARDGSPFAHEATVLLSSAATRAFTRAYGPREAKIDLEPAGDRWPTK